MKKLLVLLLALYAITNAQNKIPKVSSFIINEELGYNDPVDLKLGRYEVFEIKIGQGDNLAVELESQEFWPVLLLISPSKKSIIKFPKGGESSVFFDTTITESGTWELYVIGDTNSVGKYTCEIGFAEEEALIIPDSKDECSVINYFKVLANANFIFVRGKKDWSEISNISEVHFNDKKVSFNIKSVKPVELESEKEKLLSCLGKRWIVDSEEAVGDGFKLRLIENVFKNRRYLICNYSKSKDHGSYRFTIGRE